MSYNAGTEIVDRPSKLQVLLNSSAVQASSQLLRLSALNSIGYILSRNSIMDIVSDRSSYCVMSNLLKMKLLSLIVLLILNLAARLRETSFVLLRLRLLVYLQKLLRST